MFHIRTITSRLTKSILVFLFLCLIAGCSGAQMQTQKMDDGYVEIQNPAFTTSPNAPERIWVPRQSVESGVPRGGELIKRGYNAMTEGFAPAQAAQAPSSQPVAPQTMTTVGTVTAPQAGITAPGGKAATFIPRFGLVVAVDGEKVYFNLGRDSGITPFQKLKVYRGGTVVEGLGLAPGAQVATIEVQGFVGTGGGYGVTKNAAQIRVNDLVGSE